MAVHEAQPFRHEASRVLSHGVSVEELDAVTRAESGNQELYVRFRDYGEGGRTTIGRVGEEAANYGGELSLVSVEQAAVAEFRSCRRFHGVQKRCDRWPPSVLPGSGTPKPRWQASALGPWPT